MSPSAALLSLMSLALLAASAPAMAGITPLSRQDCASMKAHGVISPSNPVPCQRLARVSFDYTDFDGAVRAGAVVVLDAVAPQVESLFGELLLRSVPLASAQPLEAFDGDDEKSMAANNTSAFNGRPMTGGGAWSKHAYGAAIDINPLQNPYVSQAGSAQPQVLPPAAQADYLQRRARPGMAETVVDVFFDHGFLIWGGNWKQPIDYQHFEIGSRAFITRLARLPQHQARAVFERYVSAYRACADPADAAVRGDDEDDGDSAEDVARRQACAARLRQ